VFRIRRQLEGPSTSIPADGCELCGQAISGSHGHLLSLETRHLVCVCPECYLRFTPDGAGERAYRAVPRRCRRLDVGPWADAACDALTIPHGIAFFLFNAPLDRVVAFYPGTDGPAEAFLPAEAWAQLGRATSLRETLAPDVEGLLVARRHGAVEAYAAPIDICYELIGLMRRRWRSFSSGGSAAEQEIDAFFLALAGATDTDGSTDPRQ
jgi:hypothetical protein